MIIRSMRLDYLHYLHWILSLRCFSFHVAKATTASLGLLQESPQSFLDSFTAYPFEGPP